MFCLIVWGVVKDIMDDVDGWVVVKLFFVGIVI